MTPTKGGLSSLPDMQDENLKLEHKLLKDRAADKLRDHISSGRIPEGTKLTEREVSRLLGIGRAPTRDALMALEAEGLVVSKSDGRYVIEITEKDVRDIHVLRWTLERLAVELAAANTNDETRAILDARLRELEAAIASGDPNACTRCDMAIHRAIWQQADNPHLLHLLDSVLGAIFVLCDRAKVRGRLNAQQILEEHRELVTLIIAGDATGAGRTIEAHLRKTLGASLRTFHLADSEAAEISQESPVS
jgi:DNA-binding GntR family transcriptional regulator